MRRLLNAFLRSRAGNYSMMLAVLAVPVIGAVGYGVDFAEANRVRSLLHGAADAAAVGSVAESSPTYKAIGDKRSGWTAEDSRQDALNLFNAYLVGKDIYDVTADAKIVREGMEIRSTVTYKVKVPMRFMSVLGRDSVEVSGKATASVRTAAFLDFYMLLDNTPSMGIGATPKDVATMVANTPNKCGFACHETKNPDNYYNLAKKLSVTMRIDTVREATRQLFDTADEVRQHTDQFRMAAYTFGDKAEKLGLKKVVNLTSNMRKAKADATTIDLMTIPSHKDPNRQTDFDRTLADLNTEIKNPGSGASESDRQKIVFFVSDGLGDSYKPSACTKRTTDGRCQEPIDIRACEALKARGVTIAVLYTTYLPLTDDDWYNTWIAPFADEIGPRMEACATPGLFFEVSPTDGIADAMKALFIKIVSNPRITS